MKKEFKKRSPDGEIRNNRTSKVRCRQCDFEFKPVRGFAKCPKCNNVEK